MGEKFPNRIDLPPMEFSPQTRFAVLPEGVGIALVPPAVVGENVEFQKTE